MDTWDGIEVFIAVVDEGSLTAAALRLGTSVANVSRTLQRLESRLAVVLLRRTTRSQHLTDAGTRLYEEASLATRGMRSLEAQLRQADAALQGPIRVSSAGGYVVEWASEKLAVFAAQHPKVAIELDVSARLVNLASEPFDVAIRGGLLPDSGLKARRLFERRYVMCASPSYLRLHGTPRKPADLKKHECIRGFSDQWPLLVSGRLRRVAVHGRWSANHGAALVAAAKAGLGLLYQPETMVRPALTAGALVEVMPTFASSATPVWAVYSGQGRPSRRVEALVAALSDAPTGPAD